MSSDYIPRLRRELLRAGASEPARWRAARVGRALRPVAVAAAVALLAVAGVLSLSDGGGGETPAGRTAEALRLTYRVEPSGTATTEQTARVLRERLAAAGIPDGRVAVAANGGLAITVPAAARAEAAALGQPGRLAFYDWERSVLGPRGTPAPADASVTGGPDAGRASALSEAEARSREAKRPGARVVRAADGWFALGSAPTLTHAGVAQAAATVDPRTGEPVVALDLTARGRDAFDELTRELARRGAAAGALQHFAIVLDGRLLSVPFIHYRLEPNGLDDPSRAQIAGDLTPRTARRIAALLSAGPLGAKLVLESESATR